MSTKDDVFNYVMNSPENTNPAVLRSLLDNLEAPMQEKFIITITYDSLTSNFVGDKTLDEVIAAYNSGKNIIVGFSGDFSEAPVSHLDECTCIITNTSLYEDDIVGFGFFGNAYLGDLYSSINGFYGGQNDILISSYQWG